MVTATSDRVTHTDDNDDEFPRRHPRSVVDRQTQAMTNPPAELAPLLSERLAPQRAFAYKADTWRKWLGHLDGVDSFLARLPDRLDRRAVAQIVEDNATTSPVGSFAASMVWGHGNSGYGAHRTAAILQNDRSQGAPLSNAVVSKLEQSIEVSRAQGAVEGYRYLNNRSRGKIAGLGPAFFTKWLFFVTARGDVESDNAAPVLDKLVIDWMNRNGVSLRAGQTADYQRYVDTLREWGAPHALSPAAVEERIFRVLRNDGA